MTDFALVDWDDVLAYRVLEALDINDMVELALWREGDPLPLALWHDWKACVGWRPLTRIALWGSTPVALLGLQLTGRGVAQAALLSRDHHVFRRALVRLARRIRSELPDRAAEMGIARIECRSWTGHPTAGRLLTACGFRLEAELAGYPAPFAQYAWTRDPGENPCA